MKGYFITGTDTGVGKTLCAAGLLEAFKQQGKTTIAMKPVASGCEETSEGLRNEDALLLMQHMTAEASYEEVNPYTFVPPMAPHLAAVREGLTINSEPLVKQARQLSDRADCIVIEGAGGWLAPLNETQSFADLAKQFEIPVILVVGIRLGCLNHALLTVENMQQRDVCIAGWIANAGLPETDDCMDIEENIASLVSRIAAPLLGTVPQIADKNIVKIASLLDVSSL
ncbi:MAG: dethiobiotin synthase [Sulfuriflexus sp.]|nr:dethiobiotin synthase [Sulfuriflexus sp.]